MDQQVYNTGSNSHVEENLENEEHCARQFCVLFALGWDLHNAIVPARAVPSASGGS
jgi:hypothetical protein